MTDARWRYGARIKSVICMRRRGRRVQMTDLILAPYRQRTPRSRKRALAASSQWDLLSPCAAASCFPCRLNPTAPTRSPRPSEWTPEPISSDCPRGQTTARIGSAAPPSRSWGKSVESRRRQPSHLRRDPFPIWTGQPTAFADIAQVCLMHVGCTSKIAPWVVTTGIETPRGRTRSARLFSCGCRVLVPHEISTW